jgi:RNase P subunit RPR2
MSDVPTLDWTCAHCGNNMTLELVMLSPSEGGHQRTEPMGSQEAPRLDWTCSRCGTTETYMLVASSPRA